MKRTTALVGAVIVAALGLACGDLGDQSDTDAPVVGITSPLADSTVAGTVSFSAQVFDGFGVAKVEFIVDGETVGEDITSPYATLWNTRSVGDGVHALRVQATDNAGNVGFASISVTVDNAKQ
ncbi:MAG: Ig-like domain-containing protein [Gemmatimonadales bacterium]